MKGFTRFILIAILILGAGWTGFWYGKQKGAEQSKSEEAEAATTQGSEESHPVVPVFVSPIRRETIAQVVKAYGSVVAQPQEVRIVSVPFESRVGRVLVTAGQEVSNDTELLQIDPSPDALVAFTEAKNTVEAADRDLKQTEQRFANHLATNQEISLAQQTLKSARLKLSSLVERGADKPQHLVAGVAGVVNKVNVQEGQIIPAGGALVEIAVGNRIEIELGVNPEDAPSLKPGQAVKLSQIGAASSEPLEGHIRLIGQRVDPATRLVSVMVSPPADSKLMLSTYIVAELTKSQASALVVPRDAVLPMEAGEFALYTVNDGHAKKHAVHIGLENDHDTQIISDDLKEGDPVIVLGNFELEDGMQVQVQPNPTTAPSPPAEAKP